MALFQDDLSSISGPVGILFASLTFMWMLYTIISQTGASWPQGPEFVRAGMDFGLAWMPAHVCDAQHLQLQLCGMWPILVLSLYRYLH